MATTVSWENLCEDEELQEACAVEAHTLPMPSLSNTLSWEPAPKTLREILKMPDGPIKTAWLQSVCKEFKTLVDNNTFVKVTPKKGKSVTPIMETFRVKILSDGSLDKLKTRIVVRGDLQAKNRTDDKWSPMASFRALKMFLAHASRIKTRVKQLDFVGAFLQAKTRNRVFVLKKDKEHNKLYVLNYVDDMLYYGNHETTVNEFEQKLQQRFNLELMGQAHWYLSTKINQLNNFDIEIDQSRYCRAIMKKYLDTASTKRDVAHHPTPLPLDFIPTSDNCSPDNKAVHLLETEFNIDYDSCIGSLIY